MLTVHSDTDLWFASPVGNQPDVLHGAMSLTDLFEFLFSAGKGEARDEQLVFLQGSAVPEHLGRKAGKPTIRGPAQHTGHSSAGPAGQTRADLGARNC